MKIVVVTESDHLEEISQEYFGPFSSHEEAFSFGEKKLLEYDGEYDFGWTTDVLKSP